MIRINLLREPTVKRAAWTLSQSSVETWGVLLFVITAVAMGLWYWTLTGQRSAAVAEKNELEQQSMQLQAARAQLRVFQEQETELRSRISVIEKLQAKQHGPVTMMNSVIQSVPDEPRLWLTTLSQSESVVSIEGRAFDVPAIADFIFSLQNRAPFVDVELEYWEEEEDLVKFKLNCELETG